MRGLNIALKTKDLIKHLYPKGAILLGILHYVIAPIRLALFGKYNFYLHENALVIRSLNSLLKLKSNTQGYEFPKFNIKGIFRAINPTGDSIVDEILGERVQNYAEGFIPTLWKGLNYLESIDRKKKLRAYIDIVGASDSFHAIPTFYFSREKKPVIVVQHGAYGLALDRLAEYREFGHNRWFLAWGEGIKEMYEGHKKGNYKIISTGSHLIEEILEKKKGK